MCFYLALHLGRVVPTVNVGSQKSRERMKMWVDKWELEKRKNGRLELTDGQLMWP